MAAVQQEYRFKFTFDRKDIKKQLNNISLDVKDALANMGEASDKVKIFKDLVEYISNVDKALDVFKTKHKDDFANLFGNMDTDITTVLAEIFSVAQKAAAGFTTLRERIEAAKSGKAGLETLRGIATEINDLFVSVGKAPHINIDEMFTGRGSKTAGTDFEGRIKILTDALGEFGVVYSGVQDKLKHGFNFGGTGGGSGSGIGDGIVEDIKETSAEIQAQIDKLEQQITELEQQKKRIQETIRALNGETIDISISKKNDAQVLKRLINEYKEIVTKINDPEFRKNASKEDTQKLQAERVRIANQLVSAASFVENGGSDKAGDIWTTNSKTINEAQAILAEFKRKSQTEIKAIIQLFENMAVGINKSIDQAAIEKYLKLFQQSTGVKDTITSYEQLIAVLKEYQKLVDSPDSQDSGGLDSNTKKEALYDLIAATDTLGKNEQAIFDLMDSINTNNLEEVAKKLKEILGLKEKINNSTGSTSSKGDSQDRSDTGIGKGGTDFGAADVDFSVLEGVVKAQTEELKAVLNNIKGSIDKISNNDSSDKAEVDAMKANLLKLFQTVSVKNNQREFGGNYQQQELLAAVMTDRSISINNGEKGGGAANKLAEMLLSDIQSSMIAQLHSHPFHIFQKSDTDKTFLTDTFSGSTGDLNSTRFTKSLGAQLFGLITGNVLKTFDVSKLSNEQMNLFVKALNSIEQKYANDPKYSKYVGWDKDNNSRFYHEQTSLEEQHKITEIFESMMYEAFKKIGLSKEKVDSDIFKQYDITSDKDLTDIAQILVNLSRSANDALTPVQRLSEIIQQFHGNVNTSEAQALLKGFEKGELGAADVFNRLTDEKYRVSQNMIDSMMRIDSTVDESNIEAVTNKIYSILSSIDTNVQNIANNTQLSKSEKLTSIKGDLVGLKNRDFDTQLLNGVQSIYDPTNNSEYQSRQTFQQANASIATFYTQLDDVLDRIAQGMTISFKDIQDVIDGFGTTLSHTVDANKQLRLYSDNYGKAVTTQNGVPLKELLNKNYNKLMSADTINKLLSVVDYAQTKLLGDESSQSNTQKQPEVIIDSRALEGAMSGLSGKVGANTQSVGNLTGAIERLTGAVQKDGETPKPNTAEGAQKTADMAHKQESYNKLVNYIAELINFKSAANNKDRRLLPRYDENGVLQSGSGYYGTRDIKNNRATKASIRRQLDLYATDLEFGAESGAKRTLEDLISCVATYQDLDEARSVFKQKELGIWDEIVNRINAAKKAQESYEKYDARADIAMRNAASIGSLQDKSFSWGDFGEFEKLVDAGNLDNVLAYLKKRFQIDLSEAVETSIAQPSKTDAESSAAKTTVGDQTVIQEARDLEQLRIKLGEVQAAITKKTDAFVDEGTTVGRIVGNEIVELQHLYGLLEKIRDIVVQLSGAEIQVKTDNLETAIENAKDIPEKDESTGINNAENDAKLVDTPDLNDTLKKTNSLLEGINHSLGDGTSFSGLVDPLKAAVDELKKATNGIIEEHKRKAVDTRDADAKLADAKTREVIRATALKAVENAAIDGGKMDVTGMDAMADGAIRVTGYVQTAADKWEGFTLKVNQAGEAGKIAWDANAKAAKEAQKLAEASERVAKGTENAADKSGSAAKTADQLAKIAAQNKKQRELDRIVAQANYEKGQLGFNFNARGLDSEQNGIISAYDALIDEIDKYELAVKNGQQAELDGINKTKEALYQQIDAYKEKHKIANAGTTGNKKAFGASVVKNAKSKYSALTNAADIDELKGSPVVQNQLAQYTAAYEKLVDLQAQYKVGQTLTKDEEQEFNDARIACSNYAKEFEKLLKAYQKSKDTASVRWEFEGDFEDTSSGRQKAFKDFLEETYGASATFEKFDKDFNQMIYTVDNGDGTFTRMTASVNNARTAIEATAGEAKEAKGTFAAFWDELKGKFKSIGSYLIASFSFQEVIQVVRQGIQYVREIDSALTELKKVTDETDASYNQFLKDMAKTGSVIGATIADLTTMASEWARLGYSMEESAKLAESTAILLNVSEFQSATEASEALISTMQAFQYTADDSMHVVDILNEVGNNYAISSDGIATALQDSASALMEGGNNLEQATALVAAANKVVQDPNSVGSALRTISLRLRGTSVEILEEMGEETDGVIESTSKLQAKIKALSGIDILTESGDYKDTYTILKEIGQVWEDMSDIDQAEYCLYVQKCA